MKSASRPRCNFRASRLFVRAIPMVFVAVLAACGGDDHHHERHVRPPLERDCTFSSDQDGFAIGSCRPTGANVFQRIDSEVVVNATDAYTLTLTFVGNSGLDQVVSFDARNRAPDARSLIGKLRGQAFESPPQGRDLTPPFVALTDFFAASDLETSTVLPTLQDANFGTWEKFPGLGVREGFDEGFLGVWFSRRNTTVTNQAPTTAATYEGRVVGVVGDEDARRSPVLDGRFGFSAPVTIEVAGTRILSATLGALTISFRDADGSLQLVDLALNFVTLEASSMPPSMTGFVSSALGTEASSSGRYEAMFFGLPGEFGREIAGRMRFRTSNGLVAVAAFGAIRQ